ncbi:MAG: hypothetical protein ACREXR_20515, partial [Gammaproteobacteria bacterium]
LTVVTTPTKATAKPWVVRVKTVGLKFLAGLRIMVSHIIAHHAAQDADRVTLKHQAAELTVAGGTVNLGVRRVLPLRFGEVLGAARLVTVVGHWAARLAAHSPAHGPPDMGKPLYRLSGTGVPAPTNQPRRRCFPDPCGKPFRAPSRPLQPLLTH